MVKFDESKVINALHPEKAEVGKKYYFNDFIYDLKNDIEKDDVTGVGVLGCVYNESRPFEKRDGIRCEFLYPYEEPPKQRMTNRQLAEWCAKGNGECRYDDGINSYPYFTFEITNSNNVVGDGILIRSWDSDEWVEPTVDIYERDCK